MPPAVDASAVPFVFGAAQASALPGPVLVAVLTELGASVPAAKGLLNRLVRWGQLELERRGRVGVYRLAGQMASGYRVAVGERGTMDWDGRFHLLIYTIGEQRRRSRDALRTAAAAHGYRSMRPGVLAGPRDTSSAFLPALRVPGLVTGWLEVDPDDVRAMVERAWGVERLRADRTAMASELERRATGPLPTDGRAALVLEYEWLAPGYLLLLADLGIPRELLADDVGLGALGRAIEAVGVRLGPPTVRWIAELADRLGYADLVEPARH